MAGHSYRLEILVWLGLFALIVLVGHFLHG